MLYKKFRDLNLSMLGMGNMRLPKIEGKGEAIDEVKAGEIIEKAFEGGINYFDTAYRYHGGESERFTGKMLSGFKRDSFYLATKMPGHMMKHENGKFSFTGLLSYAPAKSPQEVFEEQLERCRVDYFDFYLLHNLSESSFDMYTDEEVGIAAFLIEQKKKGRIRHLGFSAHGRAETIEKYLKWSDSRFGPGTFEIGQIQLNYLDWTLQNAKKKYEVLSEHGIRVVVMEPCRGGKLASFDEKTNALFKAARPDDSIASWAFRFVKSLPNVQVTLSGMNSAEQLADNLKTFSDPAPLAEKDRIVLDRVIAALVDIVPCTGCGYCSAECPRKLDIPKLISIHNETENGDAGTWNLLRFTLDAMKENEMPSACINCGNCAQVCPQGIDIPAIMKKLAEAIEKNSKPKS